MRDETGYRARPTGGPTIRSDIVDVYVYRRGGAGGEVEFLQLLRAREPLAGTWHPVMGHVEAGETAEACARRELEEEVGLREGDGALVRFWALEQVHPYFVPAIDAVVLSPRFAAEVRRDWVPRLNAESCEYRWTPAARVREMFMWSGQGAACAEVIGRVL